VRLYLVFALLVLGGQPVLADTPDRDPVVKHFQKEFASAVAPRPEDLRFGKKWTCSRYVALKDHDGKYQDWLTIFFEPHNERIELKADKDSNKPQTLGSLGKKSLNFYYGRYFETLLAYRISSSGELIKEEISLNNSYYKEAGIASATDPTHPLVEYDVCGIAAD